jgi:hypothetical protein
MVNKIPLVTTSFNPNNDTKRISLWSGRSVRWRQSSYRDAQPSVRSVATKVQREQFVADTAPSDRLTLFGDFVHRLD